MYGMDEARLEEAMNGKGRWLQGYVAGRIPRKLRSTVSPEDICQDVVVEVIRKLHASRGQPCETLDTWLRCLADHRLIDHLREAHRLKRGAGEKPLSGDAPGSSGRTVFDQYEGPERTASQEFAIREAMDTLNSAISQLPEDQRQAITLRGVERRPVAEVARQMGSTVDSVRGLLRSARATLRRYHANALAVFDKKAWR